MKRNRVLGTCSIILLLLIAVFVYITNMPIITMSRNVIDGEPVANGNGFPINKTKDITISYSSNIKDGDLSIRLTDEDWNTIKEFKSGETDKEIVHLEKGNYYVRVESEFFKGNYSVKVYD